jgi:hypothetical protein
MVNFVEVLSMDLLCLCSDNLEMTSNKELFGSTL